MSLAIRGMKRRQAVGPPIPLSRQPHMALQHYSCRATAGGISPCHARICRIARQQKLVQNGFRQCCTVTVEAALPLRKQTSQSLPLQRSLRAHLARCLGRMPAPQPAQHGNTLQACSLCDGKGEIPLGNSAQQRQFFE